MGRKWFHGSRISGFSKPQWKPHVSPCGPNKTKVLSNVKQSWLAFAESGFISLLSDHGDKRKRAKTNPHRRGAPLEEFASDRRRCDIMEFKTASWGAIGSINLALITSEIRLVQTTTSLASSSFHLVFLRSRHRWTTPIRIVCRVYASEFRKKDANRNRKTRDKSYNAGDFDFRTKHPAEPVKRIIQEKGFLVFV